jgi:hypothetical protein
MLPSARRSHERRAAPAFSNSQAMLTVSPWENPCTLCTHAHCQPGMNPSVGDAPVETALHRKSPPAAARRRMPTRRGMRRTAQLKIHLDTHGRARRPGDGGAGGGRRDRRGAVGRGDFPEVFRRFSGGFPEVFRRCFGGVWGCPWAPLFGHYSHRQGRFWLSRNRLYPVWGYIIL